MGAIIYGDASSLSPNYERAFALHVGDRIIAFDERLDTFPGAIHNEDNIAMTDGVLLLDVIVTSFSSRESYTIPPRRCYELSTPSTVYSHYSFTCPRSEQNHYREH